jgi:hypothetical protein
MKSLVTRSLLAAVLALVASMTPARAAAPKEPVLQPDKAVILSTVDVKGKTSPCG